MFVYIGRRQIVLTTLLVFGVLLMLLATPSFAQELTESFTSTDKSLTFRYPPDFAIGVSSDNVVTLMSESLTLEIHPPANVREVVEAAELPATLVAFLATHDLVAETPETVLLGGRDAAWVELVIDGASGQAFALPIGETDVAVMIVTANSSRALAASQVTIVAILETMNVPGASDSEGGLGAALAAAAASSASLEDIDCTVHTEQANSASVRVGPGTNRTAMMFLQTNHDFQVLGQAIANDGSAWWKLDKEEVGPNTSANELWVAQDQVIASANCDLVPDVAAPPIIPIIPRAPEGAEGEAAEGIVPASGVWTLTVGRFNLDCPGLGTISVESGIPSGPIILTVIEDGNALLIDVDRLNRLGPGFYQGSFNTLIDGDNIAVTYTLQVQSENRIEGQMTASFEGCNLFTPLTFTR